MFKVGRKILKKHMQLKLQKVVLQTLDRGAEFQYMPHVSDL